ncbi:MAG: tetratricopeptide repeat protein [Candidatus Binatia bacterium]
MLRKAMRLNPGHPYFYLSDLGWLHLLNGQYDEAIAAMKEALLSSETRTRSSIT